MFSLGYWCHPDADCILIPLDGDKIFDFLEAVQTEKCPFCGGPVENEMLLCPHCWELKKRKD